MSAQVTEAHIARARASGYTTDKGVQMAAQFVANNEAAKAERDQLRAECNNLRADLDAIKAIRDEETARAERAEDKLHALRLVCGTTDADKFSTWVDRANARAEKAESELADIRALADRRNKRDHSQDTTHQLVAALDQALDIAQGELATERARLRQIALDACRSAKITPIVWYPKRYAIDPNDFGIINEQQVEACAQAIDAAMKEETK